MKYKVGDKLLCKKSYKFYSSLMRYKIFIEGEHYLITNIRFNGAHIYLRTKETTYNSGDWFIDGLGSDFLDSKNKIGEYFYSKQEERKLKLKLIN